MIVIDGVLLGALVNKKGLKPMWCHCCCLQYCDSDGWRVVGRSDELERVKAHVVPLLLPAVL